jgi:hypothetical protein
MDVQTSDLKLSDPEPQISQELIFLVLNKAQHFLDHNEPRSDPKSVKPQTSKPRDLIKNNSLTISALFSFRSTQGGTSIASGLRLGLHVLTSRRMRNPVACMFCLSDGQDNVGGPISPGDSFAVHNRELLTSALREGVSVHTFGYGR